MRAPRRPAAQPEHGGDADREYEEEGPAESVRDNGARQVQPAHVEERPAAECEALLRHGEGTQHGDIPDQELQEDRHVAHDLDVDERQACHEPVRREAGDADGEAQDGRGDDAEHGDEQRVREPDEEGARVAHLAVVVDQRLRDVEAGGAIEEAEARGDVLLLQVRRRVGHDLIGEEKERQEEKRLGDAGADLGIVGQVGQPGGELGQVKSVGELQPSRVHGAPYRIGGAYISPPSFHRAFLPRSILRREPMPELRSKLSP